MRTEQFSPESFFRLIYNIIFGPNSVLEYSAFQALLAHVWLWVTVVGYAVSVVALFIIVFSTTRLFELRRREEEYYRTLLVSPDTVGTKNVRWQHIESLLQGTHPSRWREAITEADIMLDDVLTAQGYLGESLGDKLKNAKFSTIEDAWEAHKVRNRIAHEGSALDLSEALAQRTLQHYEAVFRELKAI